MTGELVNIVPLINAAISKDMDESIYYWQKWKDNNHSKNQYTYNELRAIPLAWYKLKDHIDKDYTYRLFQGLYKKALFQNTLLMRELKKIVNLIQERKINYCVLKGIPLMVKYYPSAGCRTLSDVDLLIEQSQLDDLVQYLLICYSSVNNRSDNSQSQVKRFAHSISFEIPKLRGFDLHYRSLNWSYPEEVDKDFLKKKIELSSNAFTFYGMNPSDMFFHILVNHGLFNKTKILPWILDIALLLENETIDTERIQSMVKTTGLGYIFSRQLALVDYILPGKLSEIQVLYHTHTFPAWQVRAYNLMNNGKLSIEYIRFIIRRGDIEKNLFRYSSLVAFLGHLIRIGIRKTKKNFTYVFTLPVRIPVILFRFMVMTIKRKDKKS